jgi:hypothetical protein
MFHCHSICHDSWMSPGCRLESDRKVTVAYGGPCYERGYGGCSNPVTPDTQKRYIIHIRVRESAHTRVLHMNTTACEWRAMSSTVSIFG